MISGLATAQTQDPIDIGRKAFQSANFPWHEAGTNTPKSMESANTQSAASANRNQLPRRVVSQPQQNTPPPNWLQSSLSWLQPLTYVLLPLLIIVLAGAMFWTYLRFRPTQLSRRHATKTDPLEFVSERVHELPFDLNAMRGSNLEERSQAAAASGDYAKAMMLLFSYVLLSLDQKGFIRLSRGTTNRQYLNQIRQREDLSLFYQQVMVPFEESFFGGHSIDRNTFERCWQNLSPFRQNLH